MTPATAEPASTAPSQPAIEYIPDKTCEQCGNPIPVVNPDARRKGAQRQNVASKRFCSAKCRSYKYWTDHAADLRSRRKMKFANGLVDKNGKKLG